MASSSASIFTAQVKYDVFLSFRGEDTRDNFTSHLNAALSRRKVKVFIDDQLIRGEVIAPSLLNAIEESKISVIIFSKGYASSRWCLEEVVKILECKKMFDQIVIPVFYHVDPSHVRNQSGPFGDAFVELKDRYKERIEMLQGWRDALKEAANLSGFDSHVIRPESELVETIIQYILKRLNDKHSSDSEDLIGIESKIDEVKSLLRIGLNGVLAVGIWGIGGIGKTTLARAVFNKICTQFECSYFVENVREESEKSNGLGLTHLQKELLSTILEDRNSNIGLNFTKERLGRKNILIVFDDVTCLEQIEKLIGEFKYLESKSRIIITTRDKQVLKNCGLNNANIYEVKGLYDGEALRLFRHHAFQKNYPTDEDYRKLSNRVVKYTKGVPLALKVLGCFLLDRGKQDWESALDKLEKSPHKDIQKVLKISYDGLDDEERGIFLDISCFFKGWDVYLVKEILEVIHFSAQIGISVLIDKALITISNNTITMHDLLQEMGKEIVRQESICNPGQRSRLWHHNDIYCVLRKDMGTEAIQGICFNMSKLREIHLNPRAFSNMCNLMLLIVHNSDHYGEKNNKMHGFQDLEFNFSELRYLHWYEYPERSLPPNFYPESLVVLNMPNSNLEQLWTDVQNLPQLKYIDLSFSKHLLKIPDLSHAQNLESMILEDCTSLSEITPLSIRNLSKLVNLNLKNCKCLSNLPIGFQSKSLKVLILSGCSNLKTAPKISCNMEQLCLNGTGIIELSSSIEYPPRLVQLNLENCSRLESLSSSFYELKSLRHLYLSGCSNLKTISKMPCKIEELYLDGTAIKTLPSSIEYLSSLVRLNLRNCSRLESLPDNISKLKSLKYLDLSDCLNLKMIPEMSCQIKELYLDGTGIKELPSSMEHLSSLVKLSLKSCSRLESLPNEICKLKSLGYLYLSNCLNFKMIPKLSHCQIIELYLDGTAIKELPSSIEHLSSLVKLSLKSCLRLESLPNDICKLESLQYLYLSGCSNIKMIPNMSCQIKELCLGGTAIIELPSSIQHLSSLIRLSLQNCSRLEILSPSIVHLSILKALILTDCSRLQGLPNDFCRLKSLQYLYLSGCSKLDRLPDNFRELESLEELYIDDIATKEAPPLNNLERLLSFRAWNGQEPVGLLLPTLSGMSRLRFLDLSNNRIIDLPETLGQLSSIRILYLGGNNFESIPSSIINLTDLKVLDVSYCFRLNSLPELPCGLQHLQAESCTSLQALSWSTILYPYGRSIFDNCKTAKFIECTKLDQNALRNILKVVLLNIWKSITLSSEAEQPESLEFGNRNQCFLVEGYMCFPGDEIPECFNFQSYGSSIKLPRGLFNDNFVGMALCTVLAFTDYDFDSQEHLSVACDLCLKCKDGYYKKVTTGSLSAWEEYNRPYYIQSNHVILGFDSLMFKEYSEIFDDSEAIINFYVTNGTNHVEYCTVKKCGVHLFYIEDSEEPMEEKEEEEEGEDGLESKRLKFSNFYVGESSSR